MSIEAQAVVVVDLQRAVVAGDAALPAADALSAAVASQLGRARAAGALVVHLQHDGAAGSFDEPGTAGWELALPALPGERVLRKTGDDGFDGTDLEDLLRAAGVATVSICGAMSEMCVAATGRAALARGFGVILARDAHATYAVPEQGPHAPAVAAHLVSRVAEWSLGDEPAVADRSSEVGFVRPQRPAGAGAR